jgi:hypothetical protein
VRPHYARRARRHRDDGQAIGADWRAVWSDLGAAYDRVRAREGGGASERSVSDDWDDGPEPRHEHSPEGRDGNSRPSAFPMPTTHITALELRESLSTPPGVA